MTIADMPSVEFQPFQVAVGADVLEDLRRRIAATRWPDQIDGVGWRQGTELGSLQALLEYWANEFDWAEQERRLNAFDHFTTVIHGVPIHFVHARAVNGGGTPIVLTHGWPSCFLEELGLVPMLTDPAAHGLDGPAFDVVIPSYPGCTFSGPAPRMGISPRVTAGLWHRLMQSLGYARFGAHGGDFGASVATFLGLDHPQAMLGIHLSMLDEAPYVGPESRELTPAEKRYVEAQAAWRQDEYGYGEIQSTKPQTLGYGLNDSPAGLAAWIVEKWRAWSDCGGDVEARFGRDTLLSVLTLYWATQTITSSMRAYFDNRRFSTGIGPGDFVDVPTAVAVFANELVPEGTPPREWAERLYAVERWTEMPRGGHFAALEEPELLARDIVSFFAELGGSRRAAD